MVAGNNKTLLYPRRKGVDPELSEVSGRKPVMLDADGVKQLFHLPLRDAADRVGICVTSLKRVCRRLGIQRWPYTKPPQSSPGVKSEMTSNPGGMKYAECLLRTADRSPALDADCNLNGDTKLCKPLIARIHQSDGYSSMFGGLEHGDNRPVICGDFALNDNVEEASQCTTEGFSVELTEIDEDCGSFKLVCAAADSSTRGIPVLPGIQPSCEMGVPAFQPSFSTFAGDDNFLSWYMCDGEIDPL